MKYNWLIIGFPILFVFDWRCTILYQNNWTPPLLRVGLKILVKIFHANLLHEFTHHLEFLYLWGQGDTYEKLKKKSWKLEVATLLGFWGKQFEWGGEGHNLSTSKKERSLVYSKLFSKFHDLARDPPYILNHFLAKRKQKQKWVATLNFQVFHFS